MFKFLSQIIGYRATRVNLFLFRFDMLVVGCVPLAYGDSHHLIVPLEENSGYRQSVPRNGV